MEPWQAVRGILLGDSAAVLGRLGRDVEAAIAGLTDVADQDRSDAEYQCAEIVWRYFVQREACGLLSHQQVIETYAIPAEVLAKVGARRR